MWDLEDVQDEIRPFLKLEEATGSTLLDTIIGNRKVRFGSVPCAQNLQLLNSLLESFTVKGSPIEILMMWGAAKGYRSGQADFFDVMALKRLASLHRNVCCRYSKGIKVSLIWEDHTEFLLNGTRDREYEKTMRRLMHRLGLDEIISIVRESDLIQDTGQFNADARANASLLLKGEQEKVGWQGEVAWRHYLDRAASEYPDMEIEGRKWKVAEYLGITLARYQHKILPTGRVKASFVPYPQTVPDTMKRGRVEYKVKAGRNRNCTMPPWVGFGVLKEDDWTHISVREFRAGCYRHDTVDLNGIQVPVLRQDTGQGV
jgi:hypothetical protein